MSFLADVIDTALGGPSYARRLQKYADRGFAAAVPYLSPDRVSPELWRSSYAYFEHSGLLLRLGRHAAVSENPNSGIQATACRHATAVSNLAKLVVLDAGAPTVSYQDRDLIRRGAHVCAPLPTGEPGEYIVVTGHVTANAVETASSPEENDLYVSVAGLVPGIIEKACRVDEEREDPPTPEGWRAGGVVRRAARGGLTAATEPEDAEVTPGHEQIVCVYDVLTRGATFDSLRYVLDARQNPMNATTPELFQRRHAFPAVPIWRLQKPNTALREFMRGVYI